MTRLTGFAPIDVASVRKSAGILPRWASDSTVPDRLVLVTCEYEDGDESLNNIVVMASLAT